jgi:outer membrane receptor for ferrienterochelin and colicin
MSDQEKISSQLLSVIRYLSLCLCALVTTSVSAQERDQTTFIYDATYFEQFNPVTLEDMIRNIPGGASVLRGGGGNNNNRGFGANDVQILIGGRRMSGKANNMITNLSRVQAAQVERIELIRGNAEGLDIRNEGIIYNVILREGGTDSSTRFVEVGATAIHDMDLEPSVLVSWNTNRGVLTSSLSYEYDTRPRLEKTDENVLEPDRTPREFRSLATARTRASHIFTGTFGYEFQGGTTLNLNALYSDNENSQDRLEDQFLFGPGDTLIPSAIEVGDIRFENQKFEIGGDLEFDVGSIGRLKTLFVLTRTDNDDVIIQDEIANEVTTRLFSSIADYDEGETILRSTMTSNFGRHTWEYGAEGAFNTLDRTFAFNGDPLENAIVEEDRYDIFVTYSTPLSERLNLQAALTEELSTIYQNREGQTNERDFQYLKPRLELRYDQTPSDQFRLLAERTVSQLNLNDFVASRNLDDDTINFGNPNLQPESTWSYSLGYERRFTDDGGSLALEVLYQDISDHIDKILIGTDDSGIGNIGSAQRLIFNLDLTTRFGFIGAPTAVLTFSYTYDDNEVTDPFTSEKRRLKGSTPHYFRVNYRHDVENTNFAYGLAMHRRTYRERQDVSLYELSKLQAHLDYVFAEYNFTENVKMRFQAAHNLNRDGRTFDKTIYDGNIANGVVERIDHQYFIVVPDYVLSVQATF